MEAFAIFLIIIGIIGMVGCSLDLKETAVKNEIARNKEFCIVNRVDGVEVKKCFKVVER